MSSARATTRARRVPSLVTRTRIAFVTMLLWALVTAVVSLAAVNSLVTSLRDEAQHAERETSVLSSLAPTFNEAEGAGHDFVDYGAESSEYFEEIQAEVTGLLDEGAAVLDSEDEQAGLEELRQAFDEMYAPLRAIAEEPGLTEDVEASAGADISALHDHLGTVGEEVRSVLYEVDALVREDTRARLDDGEDAQRRLTFALIALFGASLAMTIFFARRMRQDVVVPVQQLGSSAERLASGDLHHRSGVERPEEFARLAGSFNAMAEALDANQRTLTEQAYHDALTGLSNRRGFVERLETAFSASAGLPVGVGVLFIDLDDFKEVNDTHGHPAGDDLLRQVAARIDAGMRSTDLVARLGGDEFAVLLAAPAEPDVAATMATRVLAQLSEPIEVGGIPMQVGASIGVAIQSETSATADELLQQADIGMYLAKDRGKQRFVVFDRSEHATLRDLADKRLQQLAEPN